MKITIVVVVNTGNYMIYKYKIIFNWENVLVQLQVNMMMEVYARIVIIAVKNVDKEHKINV